MKIGVQTYCPQCKKIVDDCDDLCPKCGTKAKREFTHNLEIFGITEKHRRS